MKAFASPYHPARAGFIALLLAAPASAQVDVLTQHNGPDRAGANLAETKLDSTNVKTRFGKLCFRPVDGNIYAQPLYASNARVTLGGQAVTRNVVIVATENNSVFAFNADDTSPTSASFQLWKSQQLGPPVPSEDLSAFLSAFHTGVGRNFCLDLTTQIGITSTPVISPDKKLIYVLAKSVAAPAPRLKTVHFLHALNMADGTPAHPPVEVKGEVVGTGMGSNPSTGRITFDSNFQLNRPALLLVDGVVYVAFSGHCDTPPFHGWLFAHDAKTLALLDVLNTTPNENSGQNSGEGGIWQSGQGPAVDAAGNIYLSTGNGSNNATPPGGKNTDFGDSVLRLKLDANKKLRVDDWFTPANQAVLNRDDADLGSSGPVLLPGTHLLVAGGKEGRIYLLDRDDLGKGLARSLHSIQVTNNPVNVDTPLATYWNIHGSPVVWKQASRMSVYVCGEEDKLKQFALVPDPSPAGWKFASDTPNSSRESAPLPNPPNGNPSPTRREKVIMPGGILSLSADGEKPGTGVVWVSMPLSANANRQVVRGILRAYDATNVGQPELWDSERDPADSVGMFAKFCPPTVADGKVFLATFAEEFSDSQGIHRVKPASQGGLQPALAIYGLR